MTKTLTKQDLARIYSIVKSYYLNVPRPIELDDAEFMTMCYIKAVAPALDSTLTLVLPTQVVPEPED
jgi:hypothetical protein